MKLNHLRSSLVFGILSTLLAINTKAVVPFRDDFSTLAPEWKQMVSGDGTVRAHDHIVTFRGKMNSASVIQQESSDDLITVRARVSQWASIYLVWSPENWCAVGQISPTPFGRLYSTAVINNEMDEADHRGVDFGLARWVRIRLGENYIRFDYSPDKKTWNHLRTMERPRQFSGPPHLLVAGKYLDTDSSLSSSDVIEGSIYEIEEEATPPEQAKLAEADLAKAVHPGPDPVEALLEGNQDDPTFEKMVNCFPPMRWPREIVGVPLHPLDIGVDWLGRIDVSPWTAPVAWLEAGEPLQALGRDGLPLARRLRDGFIPVDTLTTGRDGIEYQQTVFGWSDGFSVDKPLQAYVRLVATATNGSTAPPSHFALSSPEKRLHTWTVSPAGNETALYLRFEFPKPETAVQIDPSEFSAREEETAGRWKDWIALATRFNVPDQRVMEAYRAWIVYSLLNADTINGYIEPHDGSGFYEEMFGNSVSMHTVAMDDYGLTDYAAKVLDTQRHFQGTNGLYTQVCGLTDPGGFLVGLARHYRITGDKEWLRRVAPNILAQSHWLVDQRKHTPTTGVVRGLIKFRPYNDYQGEVFNYLGNTWCAQGLEDCGAALKEIGFKEGTTMATEGHKYRNDILRSMNAAAFVYHGQTLLPLEPDTHRLLKLERYHGTGYYGLSASPLLGIGLLGPWDKPTTWLVDILEKRGGLLAGVCEFEGGIDHAYTYGYLLNTLKRGEPRKTLLGFWSMLAFGMTRETYSPVEVAMIETGENHYTLPHLYSCTEQLRLLRALLLREDGNNLMLGEAIPRAWLEPGKQVTVTKAPTEFGELSYSITAPEHGNLQVRIDPPTRRVPTEIRLHLRDPQQRPIRSVSSDPSVKTKTNNEEIILRNLKTPVTLSVEF